MKNPLQIILFSIIVLMMAACHENPHNTFGGPSNNPHDTAVSQRDTSSVGTRTDGHEQQ